MRLNPEIRRYIWLEFSLQRLVVMPLVIAVIFYIASNGHNTDQKMITASIFIFTVLIAAWGGNKAAASITDEVNENTWDFQRLSSISPFSLSCGKIFGSALYCWYGAVMALVVYIYVNLSHMPPDTVFANSVILIFSGLICHATAIISSLQVAQVKSIGRKKIQAIFSHIIGLLIASMFISGIVDYERDNYELIKWYGESYNYNKFIAFFSVIAFLWIFSGIYWQIRNQLRMSTGPWLWIAFVLFIIFFIAGLDTNYWRYSEESHILLNSYIIGIFFLYCMVFIEPWSGLLYRRLSDSWKTRNVKKFMSLFPRWLANFLLVLVLAFLVIFTYFNKYIMCLSILASLGFIIRDIAILHYFKLYPNAKRAHTAAIFYLFILYSLIPLLLASVGAKQAVNLFIIVPKEGFITISLLSGYLQAAFFVFLALKRWKKYWH
ncbi:MAG: hypothetical protein R3D71_05695 [Rickettsiales bacterium]